MSQKRRAWTGLNDSVRYGGKYEYSLEDRLHLEDPHLAQAVINTWKYRLIGDSNDPLINFLGESLATSIYLYMKYWNKYGKLLSTWESLSNNTRQEVLKLFCNMARIISNLIIALKVYTSEPIDFEVFGQYLGRSERFNA